MNFSLTSCSNGVVGFESTVDNSEKEVLVRDASTSTQKTTQKCDNAAQTNENKNVAIQAEPTIRFAPCDDNKLAEWLRKIYPAVVAELSQGVTEVFDGNERQGQQNQKNLKIFKYQDIDLKKYFTEAKTDETLIKSAACWLSVFTQNSPILAVTCSPQTDFIDQKSAFLVVFEPIRSKSDAQIFWKELKTIPVKSQIQVLSTCPYNKDLFAAGTVSGDLYIWNYQNTMSAESQGSRVTEIFSQSNDQGEVLSMSWMPPTLGISFGLLTVHKDGSILLWKVNKQKTVLDKIFKIEIRGKHSEVSIKQILAIPNSDLFVVGTLEGLLLLCSLTQIIPIKDSKMFNPVIQELQAHQFSVTSMSFSNHNGKIYVVSNSSDGEVFFHEIEDMMDPNPKLVVKLPLPFKGNTCPTNDLEMILSPGDNGTLEIFNVSSNSHEVIEGNANGIGNFISISDNQSWIITGTYNGILQIFKMERDEI